MFNGPHPNAWGPMGGMFTLSYTVTMAGCDMVLHLIQTCLLCLAAGERGLGLQGHTSKSLLGFPWLYESGQTDWRPLSFELYSVCLTSCIHPCVFVAGVTAESNITVCDYTAHTAQSGFVYADVKGICKGTEHVAELALWENWLTHIFILILITSLNKC